MGCVRAGRSLPVFNGGAGRRGGDPRDPRAVEFVEELQASVAERLSSAPEPVRIPLASVELVKRE